MSPASPTPSVSPNTSTTVFPPGVSTRSSLNYLYNRGVAVLALHDGLDAQRAYAELHNKLPFKPWSHFGDYRHDYEKVVPTLKYFSAATFFASFLLPMTYEQLEAREGALGATYCPDLLDLLVGLFSYMGIAPPLHFGATCDALTPVLLRGCHRALRVYNIWDPVAAILFKIGVTDGWGLALSHLIGKFKGGGNALSDSVRYSRETPLGSPYGLKKLRERTFLKKPIDVIGELPTDGLVAVKDGKRQSFVKDDEIPIGVKDFRELLLNVFREVLQYCKVITVGVALTTGGERRDDGVVRPNGPPGAGRVSPSLASEFPLRERCEEVGNIGRVSVVERKMVGVAIKDATEDSIVFLGWKGNLSSGDNDR